jgi:NTP pyrophosphatase (non-canonical NTP hydrolase)
MTLDKLEKLVWDTFKLASTHDPDLEKRITVLERRVKRLGRRRPNKSGHAAGIRRQPIPFEDVEL